MATTTWLEHFLTLSNLVNDETKKTFSGSISKLHYGLHVYVDPLYEQLQRSRKHPKVDINLVEDVLVFSFVRHPYERQVPSFIHGRAFKHIFFCHEGLLGCTLL